MYRLVNTKNSFIQQETPIQDYIVIGAGSSGMQALQILTNKNFSIIALQAQQSLGGRIGSQTIIDIPQAKNLKWIRDKQDVLKNIFIEKGATWIQHRHYYMKKLCQDLGLNLRQQFCQGFNFYLDSQKSHNHQQLMKHPQYGKGLEEFIDMIDDLAKVYNQKVLSQKGVSQNVKMLIEYDKKTVTDFLQQNIGDKKTRQLIQNFLQHTQCISCDQNSMHQVLTKHARSNDIGILKQFLGVFGHQPSYLIQGGTFALINKLKQKIQVNLKKFNKKSQNLIHYKHQVINIDNKRKEFCTVIAINNYTNKVVKFNTRKVICTVPLAIIRTLNFTNLSKAKKYIFDNQLRTNSCKSFLIIKKPFWQQFATGDGLFSLDYLVNMCHDISPQDQSCGILVFFHMGKKYIQWQSLYKHKKNEHQIKKNYLIDLVCKLFKVTDQQQKCKYFEDCLYYQTTFMTNQYIRSGFQSNTRPGTFQNIIKMKDCFQSFFRDQNNIYFIGSQYSMRYASYIEGAIRISRMKSFSLIGEQDPYENLDK